MEIIHIYSLVSYESYYSNYSLIILRLSCSRCPSPTALKMPLTKKRKPFLHFPCQEEQQKQTSLTKTTSTKTATNGKQKFLFYLFSQQLFTFFSTHFQVFPLSFPMLLLALVGESIREGQRERDKASALGPRLVLMGLALFLLT